MNRRLGRGAGLLALLLAMLFLVAACGDDGSDEAAGDDGGEDAAGDDGGEDGEMDPSETASFNIAFPDIPSVSDTALLAALDDMRERGYNAEHTILSDPEIGTEGLARNEFQFMPGGGVAPILAAEQGAPIELIGQRAGNEWQIASVGDITECEDLDGARLGIHSESGTSTAIVYSYVEENCPDIEPQYVIISGSGNRVQAMIEGELDASPLQLDDVVNLQETGELEFNILANVIESLPRLQNAMIYGNADFMSENPEVTTELLRTQLEIHRRINDEEGYLESLVEKYVEGMDPELIGPISDGYRDLGVFDPEGGAETEDIQWTLEFFEKYEFTEDVYSTDGLVNRSYIEAALEQLG